MIDKNRLRQEILDHLKLYQELGVRWLSIGETSKHKRELQQPREKAHAASAPSQPRKPVQKTMAAISVFGVASSKRESLEDIWAEVKDCRRCKLAANRRNVVFGSGNPHAELMFIGEAPGSEEDEQGQPFVGRAGQLLTRIIEAIGMKRAQVYICNIIKCRPPGNRNPEPDEISACEPFVFRQIAAVRPKVICALGAIGAQTLLRTTETIGRLRGQVFDCQGAKLIATYHPAYLLRNPYEKRKVWEDMLLVKDCLRSLRAIKNP